MEAGLVAAGDRETIRQRHIDDSLRAAAVLGEGQAIADIGSGAGLPGLPLAISLPECPFVLIEPRRRAVAFLELVVDELALRNVEILHARVEEVDLKVDIALTRAFAPLEGSWSAAWRILRPGGRLIYFAGAKFDEVATGALTNPEPPAAVSTHMVASASPLVIIERRT